MTIKVKLTQKDYTGLMFSIYYNNKPRMIYTTFIGLLMILALLGLIGIQIFPQPSTSNTSAIDPQYFLLLAGLLFLIVVPYRINKNSIKNYSSTLSLQEEVKYDLTTDKLRITGESFTSEMTWDKIYKIEELKKFFLIYTSNIVAIIIPKNGITSEEVNLLREQLRSLHEVKIIKLNP
jgi:hypothetical protein